jgi:endonuclease/exonuclease/phosphatase (EEP) superfamily protein YafD
MGVEIDHILGRGLTFQEAAVLYEGGSEHFPVQTRFDLAPSPEAAAPKEP